MEFVSAKSAAVVRRFPRRRPDEFLRVGVLMAVVAWLGGAAGISGARADSKLADGIAACGQIPVRFNGRTTTLDHFAKQWVQALSGGATIVDERGEARAAAGVWLDFAARHARANDVRLVAIDDQRLQKLFGVEPRPAPKGSRANLYGAGELAPKLGDFQTERERLAGEANGDAEDSADYRRAVDDLASRMAQLSSHLEAFAPPRERTVEEFRAFQEALRRLESSPSTPAVIPPRTAQERWRMYGAALWDKLAIEITGEADRAAHPAVALWDELLAAAAADDGRRLAEAAKGLKKLVRAELAAPFAYEAPADWRETGSAAVLQAVPYDDTLAPGAAVAGFESGEAPNTATVLVHYFPGATADVARIVNHWRVQSWQAPLDAAAAKTGGRPIALDGQGATLVELAAPTHLPGERPIDLLAAVLRRDADTLVVTLSGRTEAVVAQKKNFERFLSTLKIGAPESLANWFGIAAGEPRPELPDARWLAVVVEGRRNAWLFSAANSGPFPDEAPGTVVRLAGEFVEFVEGDAAAEKKPNDGEKGGDARPTVRRLPEGWRIDRQGNAYAVRSLEGERPLFVTVTPLSDYVPAREAVLGAYLRSLLRLPELDGGEADKQWSTATSGARRARVFASAPAGPSDERK